MVARRLHFAVCAAAALALAAPATVPAAWQVRTLDQGRPAWLAGLAALPGGHTAYLVDEQAGGEHRLVLRRPDHAPRTLAASAHTYGATLAADAHGHLAVAWSVIPPGGRFRQAFAWTGGTVHTLTDGTRHASVLLAVNAGGDLAVAVTDGTTAGTAGRTWVQRGSFRRGLGAGRLGVGAVQFPYPRAFTLAPTGALALGGTLNTGSAGVVVAPNAQAPFGAAAPLPRLATRPGEQAVPQGVSLAFGSSGEIVAAEATITCTIGTGDLGGECAKLTGSALRLWTWLPSASGPGAARTVPTPAFAQAPALTSSGAVTWLSWLEGSEYRPSTLAAARIHAGGLGTTRRLALTADERVAGDLVGAAPAPNDALRVYLPAPGRPTSALDTVRLSANGTIGGRQTVVRGPQYGAANAVMQPLTPTGLVRDVVGWTTYAGHPVPRMATP